MNNLTSMSDDDLAALICEATVQSRDLDISTDQILERGRKFEELFHGLASKPDGPALLFKKDGASEPRFSLVAETLLVGRSEKCSLSLDDKAMSREHFTITRSNGFLLRNLSSTNGTEVNGEKCAQERRLQHGDIIRAGRTVFGFFEGMYP